MSKWGDASQSSLSNSIVSPLQHLPRYDNDRPVIYISEHSRHRMKNMNTLFKDI